MVCLQTGSQKDLLREDKCNADVLELDLFFIAQTDRT